MNIYDLGINYQNVYNQIAQGEDSQTYIDTLDSIDEAIENKADGYAKIIKSLEGDNEAIAREIKRLQDRKKANENGIKNLKENLQIGMELSDKKAFRTNLFSFGIQRNKPKAEVTNEEKIPKGYYNEQPMKLDKKRLLEDLQNDVEVEGAELTQDSSIRIR